MPRRRLSTEERHAKQKERLDKAKALTKTVEGTYKAEPNLKLLVCDKANKNGYDCTLIDSVLMFSSPEQAEEIKAWLLKNYGREEIIKDPFDGSKEMTVTRIPFSFGFNGALKNRQRDVSTHIDMPVNTDEYDDKETSIEDEMEL